AMSARVGRSQQIAEPAYGLNDIDAELFTTAPDEHSDGVRVAVEILIVQMLDQLGARNDPARVMHQIGEQAVFMAGELDRIAVARDAPGARISRTGPQLNSLLAWPAERRSNARTRASTSSK